MTNLDKFQPRTEQHEKSAANQENAEVTAVRPILPNEDVDVTAVQPLPLGPVFASDDTSDAVEVRPFPFDEELDVTAVQPILPNEDVDASSVQPILPNEGVDASAVHPIVPNDDLDASAVQPILPNEDVDVTAVQPLPLGPVFASDDTSDAVEVRPFPLDEALEVTAVQPILPDEELEVTAVQPIQPNQDTANTDFSSMFTSMFDDGYYSDGVMTQLEGFGIGDLLANDLYSKPTNTANNAHLLVETGEGFDPASETTTNLPDVLPSDFTPEIMPLDSLGVDLIV
ncbi:MAG: hypothetical protein ABJH07_24680 [Sedimentitalea sp.]|uniref:hypothetical protein n=1 Tax=Sedimentitalea sp. TaxID=2048915 RepID=UPI003263BA1F